MSLFSIAPFLVGLPLATLGLGPLAPSAVLLSTTDGPDGTYYYYATPPAGGDENYLDFYDPEESTQVGQTILFIHGGGFTLGGKPDEDVVEYCNAMRNLGYHSSRQTTRSPSRVWSARPLRASLRRFGT